VRAVFCDIDNNCVIGSDITISGERAHHLQVVRIKQNEDLLILNGNGTKFSAKVVSISKKEIQLTILKCENTTDKNNLSLAIALPKKDAFEDILKLSVELGISQVFPLYSEFSQFEYVPNERTGRLLESALIQSNNLFLPNVSQQLKLSDYLQNITGTLIYFSANRHHSNVKITETMNSTILIGPEAGFSQDEEDQIRAVSNIKIIHLPTPILRAPTAVATSVGYVLGLISSRS
jgi:16S rRNA (uracil1498-N3)-methyltransferase